MLKVFGHKSPDTDTICSAISYAWILGKKGQKAKAYRLGEVNKETKFVLTKFKVEIPPLLDKLSDGDEIVLVDTNNPEELPEDINLAKLMTIVDHHKLTGGLKTDLPIPVVIKPWGSTATIIWKHIKHSGVKLDNSICGILLSAIISDTLNTKSPTTTDKDKESISELSQLVGVNADELASKMFDAKSDLKGMSINDILLVDSKVFNFKGRNTRISTIETTNPQNAVSMKSKLITEMNKIKATENLSFIFFFVIDILNSNSTLVIPGSDEEELAVKAFKGDAKSSLMKLPGIVSRKKQIVPAFEKAIG